MQKHKAKSRSSNSAAVLAKEALKLKSHHPTSTAVTNAAQKQIKKAEDHPSLCQVFQKFANVLQEHHLENLPSLPSGSAKEKYAARYAMLCFHHKDKEYCREMKEETKNEGKQVIKTVKYWAKKPDGTQQTISAKEFEQAVEASRKVEVKEPPRKQIKYQG
jgi:hypothetical protein